MNEPCFDAGNGNSPEQTAVAAPAPATARHTPQRELTRLERELFQYLTANCGRPVSRNEILSSVWRLNPTRTITRTIDMHIAKLRHKLQGEQEKSGRVLTVRGQGYMLVKQT